MTYENQYLQQELERAIETLGDKHLLKGGSSDKWLPLMQQQQQSNSSKGKWE